jgi:hypothetical protein
MLVECSGNDPTKHAVRKDLDRIKQYVGKLQQAAGKPVAAAAAAAAASEPEVAESAKRLTINAAASRRVIAHVSSCCLSAQMVPIFATVFQDAVMQLHCKLQ